MVYRPSIDDRLCFVLMPFGHPFDSYYEKIIKPAAEEAHLQVLRADGIYSTGSIIQDIWKKIWAARVVVADVTDKNANVNYELGLCHAIGVPTIIITKDIGDVPFDYRHRRCIVYNLEDAEWAQKLRDSLRKTIEVVLTSIETEEELNWPYETSRAIPLVSASLLSSENPRDIVIQGVHLVAERMAKTFGPAGRRFSVSIGNREPMSYKHGYTIAEGMRSANPLELRGIRDMQQVAEEIYRLVGDGTKMGILLASTLIEQANDRLRRGFVVADLLKGIERGIGDTSRQLRDWAKPVRGDQVLHVATTAAMDAEAGEFIAKAMQAVGKDGVITVEESSNTETVMEIVEGMELDQGYLSEHFVTDPEHNEVFLENPFILVYDRRIASMKDLLPLLEEAAKSNESLFIVAEDVEGEALATLVINKMRGVLKVAAIKTPGFADTRKATLEDLAILTGTRVVSVDLGFTLEAITLADLGRAKSVTVQKDRTTILEGAGNPNDIQARIRTMRTQMEETSSSYDREKLQYRLAKLVGGVAVIKVGGISPVEIIDRKYRMVSAMHSARAAVESGVLPGGAISLYRSAQLLKQIPGTGAEAEGLACVAAALEEPIRNLIDNAQSSPTQILQAISETNQASVGFNVESKRIEDLATAGILDPTETLTIGLRVAYAHAKTILETEDWDLNSTPSQPCTNRMRILEV